MSFAKFHNSNINDLREKFNKLNGKTFNNNTLDETYWTTKHVMGPDGKGEAIVRFLPAPPDGKGGQEPDNIVKYINFAITRNGKWYINRSRTSLGANEPDPANEYNRTVWTRKDLSKEEKIKLIANKSEFYIANIFVISDPNKPENEGRVFRWQFGPQIYKMINDQLFPEFDTETPVDVFNIEKGADFCFRVTSKKIPDRNTGQLRTVPTYEKSVFKDPSARWTPEEFDSVWEQEYSLQSEVGADKCKSYDELKKEFDRVMNSDNRSSLVSLSGDYDMSEVEFKPSKQEKSTPTKSLKEEMDDDIPWDTDETTDGNDLSEERESSSNNSSGGSDTEIDDWFNNLK